MNYLPFEHLILFRFFFRCDPKAWWKKGKKASTQSKLCSWHEASRHFHCHPIAVPYTEYTSSSSSMQRIRSGHPPHTHSCHPMCYTSVYLYIHVWCVLYNVYEYIATPTVYCTVHRCRCRYRTPSTVDVMCLSVLMCVHAPRTYIQYYMPHS